VVFRFGDHVLDIERRELRCGAELVALEPQVFDLLAYLVRNRGRVVTMGRADRLRFGIDNAPQCGTKGGQ
jgi:DNA-binding response OmpR family regulator